MSNFADFLKSINLEIEVDNVSYVYYTPVDGKIHKISSSNIPHVDYEIIEVAHDSVSDIINGTRNTDDFVVTYDTSLKQLALKEVTYEEGLDVINYKLFQLPVFKTITDDYGSKRPLVLESIYDGVDVFVWIPKQDYKKDSLVWYNNVVYKLLEDCMFLDSFDTAKVEIYIEDVLITNAKSSGHFLEYKEKFQPIYDDIFVDVWYDNLKHYAGQHVWLNNAVYKIIKDQDAGTHFSINNTESIIQNVLLYNDSNKYLTFTSGLNPGDKLLDNNRLYLYTDEKISIEQSNKSVMFYSSQRHALVYNTDTNTFVKFSIKERNNKNLANTETLDANLKITAIDTVRRGTKILVGKTLFLCNPTDEHEFDINVVQNNIHGSWEIYLGKKTIKSLESIHYYGTDILYFSVTAKHDPNILYRTVEFSLRELLDEKRRVYPYKYDWEFNKEDVSVYTSKFFDSYSHEILE